MQYMCILQCKKSASSFEFNIKYTSLKSLHKCSKVHIQECIINKATVLNV